nr:hypothetical protein [Tanacetum cinerariifolium]
MVLAVLVIILVVAPTSPPSPHQSPISSPSSPPKQQLSQPLQSTDIFMDLLNTLLETCTTLTRKVENLEQDKIAQALEITKLKQSVRRLEKKSKLKASGLKRLKKGRLEESQAQVYHLDLEHAKKVLSMQDDKAEPAELKEVIKVVTIAKLMTEVVTTASTTITAAPMPTASAPRRRKVEEPKPLKRQAQIEQDKAYARELEAQINANINWNEVIEHVKRKEKQNNTVMRYKALKRKPQTKAQERTNMMVYLKKMAGFKMDFFKGMNYDEIRPIFEKHFNFIKAFLEKGEKEIKEEESKVIKRKSESFEEKAAKKQKLDEEVEELKTHLQIVPNDEDDVYTEATPLALKRRLGDAVENCSRKIVSSEPKNFSDDFLLNTLKTMFEKPNVEAHIWKNQRGSYGLAKMILLAERRYPLTRFTLDQMLNNVRLEVKEESEVTLKLLRFVRRQQQEDELEEEASKAIKRKSESSKEKAAKKHKLDEEVEELKTHLQIIPNDEDDLYIEATHIALKVPVVDY